MGKYANLEERVIANSVLSDENFYDGTPCWEWMSSYQTNGSGKRYPTMSVRTPNKPHPMPLRVHRLVLELFKGLVMNKKHVAAHSCNNTMCVNPEHIRRDTQSGNIKQAHDEGRAYNSRTWKDGSSGAVLEIK